MSAATGRKDTLLDFRLARPGPIGRDDEVTEGRDLTPSAHEVNTEATAGTGILSINRKIR